MIAFPVHPKFARGTVSAKWLARSLEFCRNYSGSISGDHAGSGKFIARLRVNKSLAMGLRQTGGGIVISDFARFW
jgi:hypothetical protein